MFSQFICEFCVVNKVGTDEFEYTPYYEVIACDKKELLIDPKALFKLAEVLPDTIVINSFHMGMFFLDQGKPTVVCLTEMQLAEVLTFWEGSGSFDEIHTFPGGDRVGAPLTVPGKAVVHRRFRGDMV
jgi:hypothetical protein